MWSANVYTVCLNFALREPERFPGFEMVFEGTQGEREQRDFSVKVFFEGT